MAVHFGIVTPTINRPSLLRRHLRQVLKQTYPYWSLLVVHDGPNPSIRSIMDTVASRRISYIETSSPAKDSGVSPRLAGARTLRNEDYLVFWDDDNSYRPDALQKISAAIERHDYPECLIIRVKYLDQIIPPASARELRIGQVDTACFVLRPDLAREAYEAVQRCSDRNAVLTINDFLVYDFLNQSLPKNSIAYDADIIVGQHDGLRWGPFIRSLLGIRPIHLAHRIWLGR